MTNWKNLRLNPPCENCEVCVKIGLNYETYRFIRYSEVGWDLVKNGRQIDQSKIPEHAMYIILDEIL